MTYSKRDIVLSWDVATLLLSGAEKSNRWHSVLHFQVCVVRSDWMECWSDERYFNVSPLCKRNFCLFVCLSKESFLFWPFLFWLARFSARALHMNAIGQFVESTSIEYVQPLCAFILFAFDSLALVCREWILIKTQPAPLHTNKAMVRAGGRSSG